MSALGNILVKLGLRAVVGGAASGIGLPVILAGCAAAFVALSSAAYVGYSKFQAWKEDLRTEGRAECVGKVNEQAIADLKDQLEKKTKEAEAAQNKINELEERRQKEAEERSQNSSEAAAAHEEINKVDRKPECTKADALVDGINVMARSKKPQPAPVQHLPVRAKK